MLNPIHIHRASERELPCILTFVQLVEGEFLPPLSSRYSLPEHVGQQVRDADKGCLLHADNCGAIRAALFYETADPQAARARLTFFAVHPDSRGSGLAYHFRMATLDWLRAAGVREVITRTWSTNQAMLTLNRRTGFVLETIVKDDRGPGIDSVYFRRTL